MKDIRFILKQIKEIVDTFPCDAEKIDQIENKLHEIKTLLEYINGKICELEGYKEDISALKSLVDDALK